MTVIHTLCVCVCVRACVRDSGHLAGTQKLKYLGMYLRNYAYLQALVTSVCVYMAMYMCVFSDNPHACVTYLCA